MRQILFPSPSPPSLLLSVSRTFPTRRPFSLAPAAAPSLSLPPPPSPYNPTAPAPHFSGRLPGGERLRRRSPGIRTRDLEAVLRHRRLPLRPIHRPLLIEEEEELADRSAELVVARGGEGGGAARSSPARSSPALPSLGGRGGGAEAVLDLGRAPEVKEAEAASSFGGGGGGRRRWRPEKEKEARRWRKTELGVINISGSGSSSAAAISGSGSTFFSGVGLHLGGAHASSSPAPRLAPRARSMRRRPPARRRRHPARPAATSSSSAAARPLRRPSSSLPLFPFRRARGGTASVGPRHGGVVARALCSLGLAGGRPNGTVPSRVPSPAAGRQTVKRRGKRRRGVYRAALPSPVRAALSLRAKGWKPSSPTACSSSHSFFLFPNRAAELGDPRRSGSAPSHPDDAPFPRHRRCLGGAEAGGRGVAGVASIPGDTMAGAG
ncbi:unnamed protein product [Urochloa humidicola]